jgi:hypothetical protein
LHFSLPLVVGALGDDVKVGVQTEGAETSIWKKCPVITFQTFEDITGTGGGGLDVEHP